MSGKETPPPMDAEWTFGSGGFAKIYGSRLAQSSLLDTALATRWCFIYMLAQADALGRFRCATIQALARAANITRAQAEKAVLELEGPDDESTNKAKEGRRIVPIAGGWQIVNYTGYRDFRTEAQQAGAARKQKEREGNRRA